MKAIILAAGRGSRMGKVTEDIPKCLAKIWGRPLIDWQMDVLKLSGIDEIGIVRGYMPHRITIKNVSYFFNENWERTNMVASLLCANDWLISDECLVLYSDIIYSKSAVDSLVRSDFDICITYFTKWLELWEKRFDNPLEDLEKFKIDSHKRLLDIGKGAESLEDIKGQYMGMLKFKPAGWRKVLEAIGKIGKERADKIDVTSLLVELLKLNVEIMTVPFSGTWLEVDNQKDLELYSSWERPDLTQ